MFEYINNLWSSVMLLVYELLGQLPSEDFSEVWQLCLNINSAITGTAVALTIIFFFAGLFKTISSIAEFKRPELAVKVLIRLVLTQHVVTWCSSYMLQIFKISVDLINSVFLTYEIDAYTVFSSAGDVDIDIFGNISSFITAPFLSIFFMIVFIASLVMAVQILVAVGTRMIKICMYTAIAPIPLSTFAGESTAMIGRNFTKSFFSVCLEGVVIAVATAVFFILLVQDPLTGVLSFMKDTILEGASRMIMILIYAMMYLGIIRGGDRLVKEFIG